MSKQGNAKMLESLIGDNEPNTQNQTTEAVVEEVKPKAAAQEPTIDNVDGLVLPKVTEKLEAPKMTKEESAAILRKQRDEARQKAQELEEKLSKAEQQGNIFNEVKKLINKDDVTPEDLQKIFSEYEFTKKEKESLAQSLKETKDRLREYDISASEDFQENYVKPVMMAAEAIKAEVLPMMNGDFVPLPKSAEGIMEKLIEDGNITPATVKVALSKIKSAYEAEDIDFEMPNVKNVTENLLAMFKGLKAQREAIENWEQEKEEKKREKEENQKHRNTLLQVKSREARKTIAQEVLNGFVNRDDFDYLAEDFGANNVLNEILIQHNELTTVIEDPSKAPTYDKLLEAYAKASLFDKLIEQKKKNGLIAIAEEKKAEFESVGGKPSKKAGEVEVDTPNAKLLEKYI